MTVLTVLVCFSVLAGGITFAHLRTAPHIPRPRTWDTDAYPIPVYVDRNAVLITASIREAVRRWNLHSPDTFSDPVLWLPHEGVAGPLFGVWIRLRYDLPKSVIGRTWRRPDMGGPIKRVEIGLDPGLQAGSYTDLVVAHELLHALGYRHGSFVPNGSIASDDTDRLGWNFRGIA